MRIFISIALFLISFSTSLLAQFDIEWELDLGVGNSYTDRVTDIIATSDGNYLMTGYSLQPNSNHIDYYLTLVSIDGEIIWEKYYGGSKNEFAGAIVEVSDGYTIIGTTSSTDGDVSQLIGEVDVWIIKLDKSGDVIWDKSYGEITADGLYNAIATSDGGYAVLAYETDDSAGFFFPWQSIVMKLNSDGDLEWKIDISHESGVLLGSEIIQDKEGHFILGGSVFDENVFLIQSQLIKLSKDGEVLWQKEIGDSGLQFDCLLSSLKLLPNEDMLMTSSCNNDGLVIKTDNQGEVIWKRTIGGLGSEILEDLVITDDGHILIGGSTSSDDLGLPISDTNILLFELDADGNQIWVDTYGNSTFKDVIRKIIPAHDGGFIAAADIGDDMSIFKLNLNSTSVALPDPISTLRLYPNPVSDRITINVLPGELQSKYSIYNSTGQLCLSGILSETTYQVDVGHLPLGSYTVQIGEKENKKQFLKL